MAMFLQDLMTGTGVQITSRNADTGGAWTRTVGSSTDSELNGGYFNASSTSTMFKSAATPAGTDYECHAFTTYKGNTSGFDMTGPAVCVDGSGNGYAAAWRLDSNGVCLYRYDAGTRTLLTSVARSTPSVDTAVKITLKRVWTGSTNKLTVSIDDTAVITDYTDATITATNSPGLIGRNAIISNGVLGGSPTGFPIDKIEAWDYAGSGDTLAPTVPGSLTLGTRTASTLPFTWSASTDNGGGSVNGYKVQILDNADTVLSTIDVGLVLAYTITGLNGGTTRKLRVLAYDNASTPNESAYCAAVSGTTLDAMSPSGAAAIATVAAAGTMTMTGTSRQFSMTLYQEDGVTPLAGRTNLWYAWWPSIAEARTAAASIYGTGASTNGSGQITFAAPSGLSVGNNQGYGVISDQDATADAAEIAYVGSFDVI